MTGLSDSGGFWLVAAGLLLGVGILLILSLFGARRHAAANALAADRLLYNEQLSGLERDVKRGLLDATEAARLRTEIARRLLEADRRQQKQSVTQRGPLALAFPLIAIIAAMAGAVALYLQLGAAGLRDLPLAGRIAEADQRIENRKSQADFVAGLEPVAPPAQDAELEALMQALRAGVDPASSEDLTGLALLARNEAVMGNYQAALRAQRRLIEVKGAAAGAEDHLMLAEILITEARGYVSPEAEQSLRAALAADPKSGLARYYIGLIAAQGGRFDEAFAIWQPLVAEAPVDSSYGPALRAQIGDMAALAGIDYTPPPAPIDDAATAELAGQMVAQLSERLASEGGSAEEWARLVYALTVLGRDGEALEVLAEARGIFQGDEDRSLLDQAARAAGLEPAQ